MPTVVHDCFLGRDPVWPLSAVQFAGSLVCVLSSAVVLRPAEVQAARASMQALTGGHTRVLLAARQEARPLGSPAVGATVILTGYAASLHAYLYKGWVSGVDRCENSPLQSRLASLVRRTNFAICVLTKLDAQAVLLPAHRFPFHSLQVAVRAGGRPARLRFAGTVSSSPAAGARSGTCPQASCKGATAAERTRDSCRHDVAGSCEGESRREARQRSESSRQGRCTFASTWRQDQGVVSR